MKAAYELAMKDESLSLLPAGTGASGAIAAVRRDVVVPEALAENINCINHVNMSEWKYWHVYAFQTVKRQKTG